MLSLPLQVSVQSDALQSWFQGQVDLVQLAILNTRQDIATTNTHIADLIHMVSSLQSAVSQVQRDVAAASAITTTVQQELRAMSGSVSDTLGAMSTDITDLLAVVGNVAADMDRRLQMISELQAQMAAGTVITAEQKAQMEQFHTQLRESVASLQAVADKTPEDPPVVPTPEPTPEPATPVDQNPEPAPAQPDQPTVP